MRYPLLLARWYAEPLAMLPSKIAAIHAFLRRKAAGDDPSAEEIAAAVAQRKVGNAQVIGKVAVLPCFGVLAQRCGGLEEISCDMVSCEKLGADLEACVADEGVRSVVLAFDSPGGSVFGIDELAAKIRAAGQRKKVVGIADSMAASAAYWLISQCSEVNVTPGGQVGSVGVYSAHEDHSAELKQAGVAVSLVSAGDHKTEGNPYEPLDDEGRAEMQRKVDGYYSMFVAAVAKGRGVSEAKVKADYGQGRMATAQEAVSKGMADRVATIDQVLRRLGAYDGRSAGAAAQARARAVELED